MSLFFGKKKTVREIIREQQREIRKSIREIERENIIVQNREKVIIRDIKKQAKLGKHTRARALAKDLVRGRAQTGKLEQMVSTLRSVSHKIQSIKSQNAVMKAMEGCSKTMSRMNKQMNLPDMRSTMMNFEKQSVMLDMKEELMNDTMDDMFDTENEEFESEEIVNQVLDEIGLSFLTHTDELSSNIPSLTSNQSKVPSILSFPFVPMTIPSDSICKK